MPEEEKVILPLSSEKMVKYFKNKDEVYIINFQESAKKMSCKSILVYLSNLQMNFVFDEIDMNMFREYITFPDLTNCYDLPELLADVIYFHKFHEPLYPNSTVESCHSELMETHREIIEHYLDLLESSELYLLRQMDKEIEESESVVHEKHKDFGFGFLSLFTLPDFLLALSVDTPPLSEQTYYKAYFDEHEQNFVGQNYFHYFSHENNKWFHMFQMTTLVMDVANGCEITPSHIEALDAMEEIDKLMVEQSDQ
jgi:hypothetical protein